VIFNLVFPKKIVIIMYHLELTPKSYELTIFPNKPSLDIHSLSFDSSPFMKIKKTRPTPYKPRFHSHRLHAIKSRLRMIQEDRIVATFPVNSLISNIMYQKELFYCLVLKSNECFKVGSINLILEKMKRRGLEGDDRDGC
jgi:hypothetical protein